MKIVTAEFNQTPWDLAIQYMGSVEGVFDILDANPALKLDMAIEAGTKVRIPALVYNAGIVKLYDKNKIKPASGFGEEVSIPVNDDDMITQFLNYDLVNGDQEFPGIRLHQIKNRLTVQINYTGLTSSMVKFYIDHSLDGNNWSHVPDSGFTLDSTKPSHTYVIIGLLTNYVRAHVEMGEPAQGIITSILWKYE